MVSNNSVTKFRLKCYKSAWPQHFKSPHLHSTMFIFICFSFMYCVLIAKYLHSTMFIFIYTSICVSVSTFRFTFHYVYIYMKYLYFPPDAGLIYIPLCLYLYQYTKSIWNCRSSIYIPLCLYLYKKSRCMTTYRTHIYIPLCLYLYVKLFFFF